MKKIVLIITTLLSLSSCRLDLQSPSDLTYDGFWNSEEAVRANHAGIYSRLRSYNYTLWRLGEVRSDIWGGITIESPADINLINNNISPVNTIGSWGNFYGMIHYLNDFIKNAPTVSTNNPQLLNHMMGQVYGLRAYVYFTLLKTYGDVPINTEPLTGAPADVSLLNKPRSPKAEVAALIKQDIQKSLDYFGTNNSLFNNQSVYWSKAATLALKGEAYLFFGNMLGGGDTDFKAAKDALTQISGFSLVPTYAGLWGVSNENNKEFVFAFDYQQNQASNFILDYTSGLSKDINSLYDRFGTSMNPWVQGGQNRYGASKKIIDTFFSAPQDTRGDATFYYLYADANNGLGYKTADTPKYRTTMLKKFIGDIIDSRRQSFGNYPVYRYADVLLMIAEAKNLLGEDPSAEINQVRKRAYAPNTAPLYMNAGKEQNTKAILDERLKEFAGEGKRWWDLQRAGAKWVFNEVATMNAAPISGDAKKIYFPITQGMLDNDPNLKQTEGY